MSVHGDDTRPYGWRGTFQFQNSKIAKITNLLGLEASPRLMEPILIFISAEMIRIDIEMTASEVQRISLMTPAVSLYPPLPTALLPRPASHRRVLKFIADCVRYDLWHVPHPTCSLLGTLSFYPHPPSCSLPRGVDHGLLSYSPTPSSLAFWPPPL